MSAERQLIDGYISGELAGTEPRRESIERLADARRVILVEGITDQIAIGSLAARLGRDLDAEGTLVAPMGGAHAIDTFLDLLSEHGHAAGSIRGLCDRREAPVFRAALERAGYGAVQSDADLERHGFFVCDADLEAELIRAVGPEGVQRLVDDQGELRGLRTLQSQAAWADRPIDEQLHRFFRAKARRMHRYARVLVDEAFDLGTTPRPLEGVLNGPG